MSDKENTILALDYFELGGDFIPQSSSNSVSYVHGELVDNNGDYKEWTPTYNGIIEYSVSYKYNTTTGLATALPQIGSVTTNNHIHIDQIVVESIYNDFPTISLTGHFHSSNQHANDRVQYHTSISSGDITGALGAYDIIGLTGENTCILRSTYVLSLVHSDLPNWDGNHWEGDNVKAREHVDIEYIGELVPQELYAWRTININIQKSNSMFGTYSASFEKLLIRE